MIQITSLSKAGLILPLMIAAVVSVRGDEQSVQVDTTYNSNAQVIRTYKREQPTVFMKCNGGSTDIDQHNTDVSNSSRANSGTQTLATDPYRNHLGSHTAQTSSYEVGYDPKNQTFSLDFSNYVQQYASNTTSQNCSTTETTSTVTHLKNELRGSATLIIPKDVYLVRVKFNREQSALPRGATVSSCIQLKENILDKKKDTNSEPANCTDSGDVLTQKSLEGGAKLPDTLDDMTYMIVRPGDLFRLGVTFSTTDMSPNQKFKHSYQILMMGQTGCDKWIGAKNTSINAAKSYLTDILKKGDVHEYIAHLSCLRNPKVVREVMLSSHPRHFRDVIDWLKRDALKSAIEINNKALSSVLTLVTYLTLRDVTEYFLSDLEKYCNVQPFKLQGEASELAFQSRTYHWTALNMARIEYMLEVLVNPGITRLLEELSAAETKGLTYKQILSDPQSVYKFSTLAQLLAKYQLLHFHTLYRLVSDLPKTDLNKKSRDLQIKTLGEIGLTTDEVFVKMRELLAKIQRRPNEKIKVSALRSKWSTIERKAKDVQTLLKDDLEFFKLKVISNETDAETAQVVNSTFRQDTEALGEYLENEFDELLKGQYGREYARLFPKGVSVDGSIDFKKSAELMKRIRHCLNTPAGGN